MPIKPTAARYEVATKTIRSVPENYWLATMDSWDAAVDHDATARMFARSPQVERAARALLAAMGDNVPGHLQAQATALRQALNSDLAHSAKIMASRFVEAIKAYCGDNIDAIRAENVTAPSGICASHNYCDANMPMAEAFESVTGRQVDPECADDAALWSLAWEIAKRDHLTARPNPVR